MIRSKYSEKLCTLPRFTLTVYPNFPQPPRGRNFIDFLCISHVSLCRDKQIGVCIHLLASFIQKEDSFIYRSAP